MGSAVKTLRAAQHQTPHDKNLALIANNLSEGGRGTVEEKPS
jgi:hypothetical protein